MKISSSAAAALLACTTTFTASAFVVPHQTPITASSRSVVSSSSSALSASTIEEASTATATTTTTTTATSSASDNSSNSSSSNTEPPPLSPLTIWGDHIPDILAAQQAMKQQTLPEFAPEISAQTLGIAGTDATAVAAQLQYFQDNAATIKRMMETHGAVIFRDFDLMKTNAGFQQFYQAVGMKVCLDPLHSVSARPTVDGQKNSPVYEAVNKESRKNFFIGMHNEFVGTRAPRAAAFCCFKPADEGGEFLLADGRRIFCDLQPDILQELYQRQIRYSVMELPFFGWIDNLPGFLQQPAQAVLRTAVTAALNAKVDFDVELLWGGGGGGDGKNGAAAGSSSYDNTRMLQARAPRQPPVVLHPVTGEPTWFCNVHSHSSKLRHDREKIYGAERFEDGASRINKSDMFFGDDGELTDEQLKHLDEVTMKNVKFVKMQQGDVVLLDNYKTLHGRNVFDGKRKHGVAWFEGWEGEEEMKQEFLAATAAAAANKNK